MNAGASFPRLVALEVTTRCNLTCVMCPHGIGGVESPRDAEPAVLEALWPAIEAAETVHLNGVGEPLMSEVFWEVIERLKGRAAPRIDFNTNGLLLNSANLERLAAAPLGAVHVSIDAATERTYQRIRGASFARVKRSAALLAAKLSDRADVKLNFVVMRENMAEMSAFVALAAEVSAKTVWFAPLTETAISAERWTVARPDGWTFDYRAQRLPGSDPALIAALAEAQAEGIRLGVQVEGDNIGDWVGPG